MIHLFAAIFTVAACVGSGRMLIGRLGAKLCHCEEWLFSLVAGASVISLLVFILAAAGLARPVGFAGLGAAALVAGAFHHRPDSPLPDLSWPWRLLFLALFVPFSVLYLVQAMGPEYSPDGSTYHLGYVARYLANGGFGHITTSIFASLSQGMEMLFLFAFAFGR